MARVALLVLVLLAACSPNPDTGLKLVTIDSDPGLSLRELPPSVLRSIGLTYGLAVVKTGHSSGLRIGDVVYGINQKQVKNLEEFNRLLGQQTGRLGLLVRRGGSDFYVAVDLGNGAAPKGPPPAARDTLLRT